MRTCARGGGVGEGEGVVHAGASELTRGEQDGRCVREMAGKGRACVHIRAPAAA